MADVIKQYAIQIQVQGSKAVIKEFKELEKVEKKQNKELKQTNSLLWTYAKRLIGIYAIYKLFKKGLGLGISFAEQGNSLKTLSSMANVSTKSLQKWSNAIRRIGGDGKSVASIMADINQKIYNKRVFGKDEFGDLIKSYGAGAYLQAQNAEDFLVGIARKMEGYQSEFAKNDILMKAGINDPVLGRFLKQGEKKVKQDLKQAEVLFSDKDIKRAEEAKKQLFDFNIQLEKLAVLIGGKALSPLTELIKELTNFLKNPKKYIAEAFSEEEVKGKPSAYAVAKDMLNPMSIIRNGWDWMLGLQKYSATTGKDFYLDSVDNLSRRIFGKDYESAMNTLRGAGSSLYTGAGQYAEKGLSIRNDISVNLGSMLEEPISKTIHEEFGEVADKVTATVIRYSNGRKN